MTFHAESRIYREARPFWERICAECSTRGSKKIAGLDLSPARVGVAISDEGREISIPLGTFHVKSSSGGIGLLKPNRRLYDHIRNELAAGGIAGWVVGWPLDLQGRQQYRTEQTLAMIKDLQDTFFKASFGHILLHDERYSTILARADALDRPHGARISLDALAASRILQEFLDLASRFE